MLVHFRVGNYRSFDQVVTLSTVAPSPRHSSDPHVVTVRPDLSLVRTLALCGDTASGKTNLLRAFQFMAQFVRDSSKNFQAEDPIEVPEFRLRVSPAPQPTLFEVAFVMDAEVYRYGFTVGHNRVHHEWFVHQTDSIDIRLFDRTPESITIYPAFADEGRDLPPRTRENALFLSTVAQFNGPLAGRVVQWFARSQWIFPSPPPWDSAPTVRMPRTSADWERWSRWIQTANVGVVGLRPGPRHTLFTEHRISPTDLALLALPEESSGTQQMIALIGPLLQALDHGGVLAIDGEALSPRILQWVVDRFQAHPETPAQLLVTIDDPHRFVPTLLRPEHLWRVHKDPSGASTLVSLAEALPPQSPRKTFEQTSPPTMDPQL